MVNFLIITAALLVAAKTWQSVRDVQLIGRFHRLDNNSKDRQDVEIIFEEDELEYRRRQQ
jgi:hypothetical protein